MQEKTDKDIPIRQKRAPLYRKLVRLLWFATILGVVGVALLFVFLSYQDLPTFEDLENPKNNLASEVYAADGQVLGRYFVENRIPVDYKDLSPNLIDALTATEDERYYDHSGIDFEALGRVAVKTVLFRQKSAGGGSTITQQLSKLLYTDRPAKNILQRSTQKLKEWITAIKLERSYTKEEIIAMYLNQFNFINGAYGIRAASEIYFNKTQDSLTIDEAATLVGMLKNPSLYNPIRRPDTTKHRRMIVLSQMLKNGKITEAEYDELRNKPLDMSNFNRKTHADGLAPYFRMELRKELTKILDKKENRKPNGEKYNIYKDGLKITTTLDPTIQKYAEEAVQEHMVKLQEKFWKTWKNKDPWTYRDPYAEEPTTDEEIEIRTNSLKKIVKGSDRYKKIRTAYMTPIINVIKKDIQGYELKDHDIERMMKEEEESGYITRLLSKKMIETPRATKYRSVMKGDKWNKLKKQWDAFQYRIKKSFDEPVKMKVFTYENKSFEKDTIMSPIDSIKYHRMFLQVGSMSVDPKTGYVKSWVGGINHHYFQFDHVTSERQVGSTFKPFIYATAISQQGMSPCHQVYDIPYTIHKDEGNFNLLEDWTPANANEKYSNELFTLQKGLQYSKNTVSVFLMKQLGDTEPVRELVNNMGLDREAKHLNGTYRIPKQPSICLGATTLSAYEMTGAYTTFANNGIYNKPTFITSIIDKNGRAIYKEIPEERQALHPNHNYVMVHMLKSVMNQGLPGFGGIRSEVGGKTGTTNDHVDGWFMGLTPDLVVGTWVGGEDNWVRFLNLRDGIGAKMARPVFAKLLRKLENDENVDYNSKARFKVPPGDLGIELDCDVYKSDQMGGDGPFQGEENEGFGDDFDDGGFDDGVTSPGTRDSTLQQANGEGGDEEDEEDFGGGGE